MWKSSTSQKKVNSLPTYHRQIHNEKSKDLPSESCRGLSWLQEGKWQNTPWLDPYGVQVIGKFGKTDGITEWADEKVEDKTWDLEWRWKKSIWINLMCRFLLLDSNLREPAYQRSQFTYYCKNWVVMDWQVNEKWNASIACF